MLSLCDEIQSHLDILHALCKHPGLLAVLSNLLLREGLQQQDEPDAIFEVLAELLDEVVWSDLLEVLVAPSCEGFLLDSLPFCINGCLRENDFILLLNLLISPRRGEMYLLYLLGWFTLSTRRAMNNLLTS